MHKHRSIHSEQIRSCISGRGGGGRSIERVIGLRWGEVGVKVSD